MNRKAELQKELDAILEKEMKVKLNELKDVGAAQTIQQERLQAQSARLVVKGDFFIKLLIACSVSLAFMYITYVGTMSEEATLTKSSGTFQLLSVIGPLFGMVLQYYFGSKKSSSTGE